MQFITLVTLSEPLTGIVKLGSVIARRLTYFIDCAGERDGNQRIWLETYHLRQDAQEELQHGFIYALHNYPQEIPLIANFFGLSTAQKAGTTTQGPKISRSRT
jgi:hypothetical protein